MTKIHHRPLVVRKVDLRRPRRVFVLTFRFHSSFVFLSMEKRRKKKFRSAKLNAVVAVLLSAVVLKAGVINHRNHYFMAKCNYEFVDNAKGAR